jgi:hypothetical protein
VPSQSPLVNNNILLNKYICLTEPGQSFAPGQVGETLPDGGVSHSGGFYQQETSWNLPAAGQIPLSGNIWLKLTAPEESSNISKITKNIDSPYRTNRQRKKGRLFQRMMSGIRWHGNDHYLRFMTLTSADDSPKPGQSWQKMIQRIRRLSPARLVKMGYLNSKQIHHYYPNKPVNEPLKFEYLRVETSEGNGVLHIPYFGDYIPHEWLKDTWLKIHGAWNVSLSAKPVNSAKKLAGYLLNQEICGQDQLIGNTSWAHPWVFLGFVSKWKLLIENYGYEPALLAWDNWMSSHQMPIVEGYQSFLDVGT